MILERFWQSRPILKKLFDTSDFLMVDALEQELGGLPLPDDATFVVLLLAKAVRLNHVALPLQEESLQPILRRQLWEVEDADEPDDHGNENHDTEEDPNGQSDATPPPSIGDVRKGVASLVQLGERVVEILPMGAEVTRSGASVVVSTHEGRPVTISFRRYAFAEHVVATSLVASGRDEHIIEGIDQVALLASPALAEASQEAKRAIVNAVSRRLSVLTGGPGRGKTTVVATLLLAMRREAERTNQRYSVALAAPTAKAAVRMRSAIANQLGRLGESWEHLQDFVTIDERTGSVHRLLGIRPDNTKSLRTLDHDLVIIDEVSMLEFTLMAKVLEHTPRANVLLVGDADQLASVDVGAALRDVVAAARVGGFGSLVTELTVNYRSTPALDELATAIKAGDLPRVLEVIERHPASIRWCQQYGEAVPDVVAWAQELVTAGYRGDAAEGLRLLTMRTVLCATKQGAGSVSWWRERLERTLPDDIGVSSRYRIGAPVLVTENEQSVVLGASEQLSNGDVGVVLRDGDTNRVVFGPSDSPRVRDESHVGPSETAWSMTIHKSQGSEYDEVIVSLPKATSLGLSRELLYTAVTRAKLRVVLVGSAVALEGCLRESTPRASGLVERVAALFLD